MLYSDIRELKAELDIDSNDGSEDKKLLFFVEQASSWIEQMLGRPGLSYKSRTEYYQGSGTQKLLLRSRPVFPAPSGGFSAISVLYNSQGYFGAASGAFVSDPSLQTLVYGTDYTLQIDQEDGTSRSGVLWRINDYWWKPINRQIGWLSPFMGPDPGSYQITYTAGYTVDTLPAVFRQAVLFLVAQMRFLLPYGAFVSSESYEELSIGLTQKEGWMEHVKALIWPYRNWKF